MERPQDFSKSAAPFRELLNARQQIADGGFEKWLYAPAEGETETPETEEQPLEAQWAEDDLKLRLKIVGGVAIAALFFGYGDRYTRLHFIGGPDSVHLGFHEYPAFDTCRHHLAAARIAPWRKAIGQRP